MTQTKGTVCGHCKNHSLKIFLRVLWLVQSQDYLVDFRKVAYSLSVESALSIIFENAKVH